jgi:hypothetical protein
MGHNKGWEEAASMFSGDSVLLETCNAALLEAAGKSWVEVSIIILTLSKACFFSSLLNWSYIVLCTIQLNLLNWAMTWYAGLFCGWSGRMEAPWNCKAMNYCN